MHCAPQVRARDYNTNWITASAILDEDTYLGAENSFNLFTLAKNSDAAADEERNHLEVSGRVPDCVAALQPGEAVCILVTNS